jgi:hypothetical protein
MFLIHTHSSFVLTGKLAKFASPGTIALCLVTMMFQCADAQSGTAKKSSSGASKAPKGPETVVAVTLPAQPVVNQAPGSLIRELGRQALLIAAESELGLTTLDKSIGEVMPTGTGPRTPFTVNVIGNIRQPVREQPPRYEFILSLTRPEPTGAPFQWTAAGVMLPTEDWLEPFAEHVEMLSRGPLLEGLKKAGYEKSTTTTVAEPPKAMQYPLDLVGQFALLRELHLQVQANETAELLGGLVETYATLGSLTRYHWSPASKAYRARALIYAERLIAKYERTPFSLAHRAFARAMCGRHATALQAIQEAKEAKGTAAPDWLPFIEAYCKFDTKHFDDLNEPKDELAQYLQTMMLDLNYEREKSFAVLNSYLSTHPTNCHAISMLGEIEALGARRLASERYFPGIWSPLYQRIADLPNLPDAAKAVVDGSQDRKAGGVDDVAKCKELVSKLQSVKTIKNQPGPGWPALAELLRNTAFSQTWQTLEVEVNYLGWNAAPTFARLKPAVKGHPLEKALLLFPPADRTTIDQINRMVEESNSSQFEVVTFALANSNKLDLELRRAIFAKIQRNCDVVYDDVAALMSGAGSRVQSILVKISPHWPTAIAASLQASPIAPQLDWEDKYGTSNVVLRTLSGKYINLNRPDDAIRCLKKSISLSPSCSTYVELAAIYKWQDKMDLWYETLARAVVETESIGLEHSSVHSELVNWLLPREEWEKARPHALAAAETFSHSGLMIGAEWAEGAGEWKMAEEFIRDCALRYNNKPAYYYWCVRTGHGDRAAARKIAEEYWAADSKLPAADTLWERGLTILAAGDRAKAIAAFYDIYKERRIVPAALFAAILADEDGDAARRDEILVELDSGHAHDGAFLELANCFRGVLSGKEEGRWNPQVMEMLAVNAGYYSTGLYLLASRFLALHQQQELADQYLQFAAATPRQDPQVSMAIDLARKQNLPIPERRTTDFSEAADAVQKAIYGSREALRAGRFDAVGTAMDELVAEYPAYLPALLARANFLERREQYAAAIADIEKVLEIDPSFYYAHLQLARILSTCEKAEFRDGKKSLVHAKKAAAWRQSETWGSVSALASAHAECGDFAKAVECETRARSLPDFDHSYDERLNLYKAGKPYHAKYNSNDLDPERRTPERWR